MAGGHSQRIKRLRSSGEGSVLPNSSQCPGLAQVQAVAPDERRFLSQLTR
jgi:hypothetical protein